MSGKREYAQLLVELYKRLPPKDQEEMLTWMRSRVLDRKEGEPQIENVPPEAVA